ncbi:hypothetical protein [Vibrio gallaecicus]|uniref:hypothetical protein n=1 Tax=Vibrio gallaecicus TaxID=552386 RepID=UPI0025B3A5FF|nr:hypothetical protein [Vibrio gallaecicus]MDN3613483.1 hypothetical protein [Vibrio gallaecicus]
MPSAPFAEKVLEIIEYDLESRKKRNYVRFSEPARIKNDFAPGCSGCIAGNLIQVIYG